MKPRYTPVETQVIAQDVNHPVKEVRKFLRGVGGLPIKVAGAVAAHPLYREHIIDLTEEFKA